MTMPRYEILQEHLSIADRGSGHVQTSCGSWLALTHGWMQRNDGQTRMPLEGRGRIQSAEWVQKSFFFHG